VLLAAAAGWFAWSSSGPTPWLPEFTADAPALAAFVRLLQFPGPAVIALALSAPLLQGWVSRAAGPLADDPYPLYAASNAGSLAGLALYPLALEPALDLDAQAGVIVLLAAASALLVAGVAWGAGAARGDGTASPEAVVAEPARAPSSADAEAVSANSSAAADTMLSPAPPGRSRRLGWLIDAALPTVILLGATSVITTDLAPVPLLWVVPLAIYLVTWIVPFTRLGEPARRMGAALFPWLAIPAGLTAGGALSLALVPIHLGVIAAAGFALHGRLARDRPAPAFLPGYYLTMAAGGALGGWCCAFAAPALLLTVAEYPLAMLLVTLFRPPSGGGPSAASSRARSNANVGALVAWQASGFAIAGLMAVLIAGRLIRDEALALGVTLGLVGLIRLASLPFAAGARWVWLAPWIAAPLSLSLADPALVHIERSFFGVHRVRRDEAGSMHRLAHGATTHGWQFTDAERSRTPLGYFRNEGPVGSVFAELDRRPPRPRRVAVIGLGTGTMAAWATPERPMTFFEIDPAVARIAADPALFTFLAGAGVSPMSPAASSPKAAERTMREPVARVLIGDGRKLLEREASGSLSLIAMDAFSSDAVPVHLLTRESLDLAFDRLEPDGLVLIQITNRYLDLSRVLAGHVRSRGWSARIAAWKPESGPESARIRSPARFVILGRDDRSLGALADHPLWKPLEMDRPIDWTDRHAPLLPVLRWAGSR
jgi:hypothetical protein